MDSGRSMIAYVAGGVLVVLGIGQLLLAPLAQSCLSSSDMRVCETIATIVLNVSGATCLAIGLAVITVQLVLSRRHKISV